jgi:hypothetical protein
MGKRYAQLERWFWKKRGGNKHELSLYTFFFDDFGMCMRLMEKREERRGVFILEFSVCVETKGIRKALAAVDTSTLPHLNITKLTHPQHSELQ